MKKLSFLVASALLTGIFLPPNVFAAAPQTPTSMTTSGQNSSTSTSSLPGLNDQEQQAANQIMGNINIATMALIYNMPADASIHINAARQIISSLSNKEAPFSSSIPTMGGKLSYKTAQGSADYWIPVVNDRFSETDLQGTHLNSQNPDVDVVDAQSVHYKMYLDIKNADDQLAKAQTAITEKQYNVAMNALQGVTKSSINEITTRQTPLASAADNLVLAQALLADHDDRGASFALKHANEQLGQAENENPKLSNDTDLKNMRSQISSLQASISKTQPSFEQQAEQKIDGWLKEVKAKI